MPFFNKTQGAVTTFGKNEYLRSSTGLLFNSYTCAANSVPGLVIADGSTQKVLQPGTVMAKITSGPDTGKIGPYQAAGTADVWTVTPGGTWSAGTYTVTINGKTTAAVAFNASLAVLQAAVDAVMGAGNMVLSGGPEHTTPTVYTAAGNTQGPVTFSINIGSVTGTSPTATPVHTTTGVAGALDGRSNTANIVGINDTFLPWQLIEGDTEVAVLYQGAVVQGWCIELLATGVAQACQNATATAMTNQKSMDIRFP